MKKCVIDYVTLDKEKPTSPECSSKQKEGINPIGSFGGDHYTNSFLEKRQLKVRIKYFPL